jgi:3D-(3,5/4)-trihydroxycyclohexane-1,2-dione acylhydrolase (decyclizing)
LLDGVRVVESAVLLNGDTVGMLLGDLGADVIKVATAAEFADAVKAAKAADTVTVIHVETDPLVYAPDSQSWWDVPVSEVSSLESTQAAYQRYADWKKVQRPLVNPSDR